MKVFALILVAFYSLTGFACRIDINQINTNVAQNLLDSLHTEKESIKSQELIHTVDFYPEVMTTSCPNATVFFHAFKIKRESKSCSIMTKYKLSYTREEIHPFFVLDIECD